MINNVISVVGLGYIGLPTAAIFANRKKSVIGLDIDRSIVATINRGEIHIVEPDLGLIVRAAVRDGYLRATTEAESADAFLIAVPTPFGENKLPDLTFVESAARSIAPVLKKGDLVVLESTSPVGTTEKLSFWLAEERNDLTFPHQFGEESDIRIAYCPERVLPGHIVKELISNDRVIGGMTPKCAQEAVLLYKTFVEGACITTDVRTAEMCKLTENSFRDVNIAFANELSIICEMQGVNVWELIRLANRHPRVNILQPGPGVGGHCIAVDPWFIVSANPIEARIIRTAREVNDSKPEWVIEKIKSALKAVPVNQDNPKDQPNVACFGLSFKPDIDDLRESPAVSIVQAISKFHTGPLWVVEPNINALPTLLSEVATLKNFEYAMENADVIVLLVDHDEFRSHCYSGDKEKVLIDCKGIWT